MKKKFLSLFLITCLFSFIGINNTLAADFDAGQTFTNQLVEYTPTVTGGISYNNIAAKHEMYTVTNSESGNQYTAYCIDRQLQNGTTATVSSGINSVYAAGLSSIINNGYRLDQTSGFGLSGGDFYVATNIAIRTYTYAVMGLGSYDAVVGTSQISSINGPKTIINTGISFACDSSNTSNVSELTGVDLSGNCVDALTSAAMSKYGLSDLNSGLYTGNESVLSAARSMFSAALQASVNAKNGNSSLVGTDGFTLEAEESNIDRTSSETEIYVVFTFNVESLQKVDYINNLQFTCEGCADNGMDFIRLEYKSQSGSDWQEVAADTDISEILFESEDAEEPVDGSILVRAVLNKNTELDAEECVPMNYTLTYDYSGTTDVTVAMLETSGNSIQRKVIAIPSQELTGNVETGEGGSGEITGEIPCEEDKAVCQTLISTPVCSDEQEESSSDIVAPEEIKKCILNNEDDAGNSYQLEGAVTGNKYCQVFCKEDYKDVLDSGENNHGIILQPRLQDVVCGGYFQLKAHIEGAKDCYTGSNKDGGYATTEDSMNGEESINKDLYLEDIERIQQGLIDAMNDYYEAEEALEQIGNAERTTIQLECTTVTQIDVPSGEYTEYTFDGLNDNEEAEYSEGTNNTDTQSFRDSATCVFQGRTESGEAIYEEVGEHDAEQQLQAYQQQMESQKSTAESQLNSLMNEYKQTITNYNSCLTGWGMEYDFAQIVRFYYDEAQGNTEEFTTSIPYYSLIMNDPEKTVMEADGDTEVLTEVVVCKETADELYECTGDSEETNDFTEDQIASPSVQEYGYDSNYDGGSIDAFDKKVYVICNVDEGCIDDERDISQASFVKKSVKKAQDYISPSVYYQIAANGKITTEYNPSIDMELLENKLPISTKNVFGGTFRLMLEDFGEFYAESYGDNYGRLIDYNGDNESHSVANALGYDGTNGFDGNYECEYLTNCSSADCPDCTFEDTGLNKCPDCTYVPTTCINCIFNLDELQLNPKPISPNDVINVDRDYGYNWIINTEVTEPKLTIISDKATLTVEEIEDANDLIYNSNKVSDGSGLAFSVRLDSSTINYLKDYNAQAEGKGGYGNDSLSCYDADVGGTTVANLYCYSEVIDYLVENGDGVPSDITDVRTGSSGRSDSNANANGYWTLWTDETLDALNFDGTGWSLTNVGYDEDTGQQAIIGGPAWK